MPSREEIVEELSSISNWCEDNNATLSLKEMTAKVSAMRCETCSKLVISDGRTGTPSMNVFCPWSNSGGCFHHEPK